MTAGERHPVRPGGAVASERWSSTVLIAASRMIDPVEMEFQQGSADGRHLPSQGLLKLALQGLNVNLSPFRPAIQRMSTIPSVSTLVSKIGVDKHWAGRGYL
jgi:hypothetical protein